MKKTYRLTSIFILAALLLSGCGNKTAVIVNENTVMKPVDSYLTKEVREYKDEGTVETPISTLSSEDGLCIIKVMPSYYDVTLDYEKGDRASVGKAYGTLIREQMPDYIDIMEPYVYENIRMAYDGNYTEAAVEAREKILFNSYRPEYKEEIAAFAEGISGGTHGIKEDGILSYEEAVLAQMIPDALRPTCCSALSLWGSKTTTGDRITLRNLEWNLGSDNQMGKIHAVTHMKNGERSLTAISVLGLLDIISGINDDGVFVSHKDIGLVGEVFTGDILHSLPAGTMAVGHTRYGTTGGTNRNNCQPIEVNHQKGHMALAHNGNLSNAAELRSALEMKGAIFHTSSDTETIAYIITQERLSAPSIEEALSRAMNRLDGA